MISPRPATEFVQRSARNILRLLRANNGMPLKALATRCKVSAETAKRAIDWLLSQGAQLSYGGSTRAWTLDAPFALPLLDPTVEDLQAALTAAGLLQALGQDEAAARAWAIFNELEAELFPVHKRRPILRDALRVAQTATRMAEPGWMLILLRAARRDVVQLTYRSPWSNKPRQHVYEPWQVALVDGASYVRGFSREKKSAVTFNLAHISKLSLLQGDMRRAQVPTKDLWGEDDPRWGIDVDRPGSATLQFHGPVARWVSGVLWHRDQTDTWLEEGELLERVLPFRSCRELARRLASVADGLRSIEPAELALEYRSLLSAGLTTHTDGPKTSRAAKRTAPSRHSR